MSHYSRNNHGFTLMELLVSIAIVSVILTVIVSNQSTYTDGAALTNLADEISSTISQAQAYGIGVKEFSPGSSEFSASFGLTFSLLGSGSNIAYLSFADRNGNKVYDGDWSCPVGGTSECREKVPIVHGNYIDSLCVVFIPGPDICNVGRVDISFARPSTEAQLLFFNNGGQSFNPADMKGAKIVLRSPGGLARSITVFTTGQVSVQ
ncbi:MAG: prepilin-type N-terminal cleavage/methylation domain-containing protein [Patescibacteria group bacterium]